MGKSINNLIVLLGLVTIAFGGYYVYTKSSTWLDFSSNEEVMRNMQMNTNVFIEHRKVLDTVQLDTEFFEDARLRSLRSYRSPIEERPVGRTDPFAEAEIGGGVSY